MKELDRVQEQREAYAEMNDCTVVALSIAVGIPYNVAHDMLERAGRVIRTGFRLSGWLQEQHKFGRTICGYKVTPVRVPWFTLAKVKRDFPRGRFIVRKRGHVFAMIDGAVMDYGVGGRTRVTNLFYFEQ